MKQHKKPSIEGASLESTLAACAAKEGEFLQLAKSYLPLIESASERAMAEVSKAKQRCEKMHFADASTMGQLDKQLKTFSSEFDQKGYELHRWLRQKHNDHKVFNVTLFGQTMVGKSTLMSILTNDHEDAIGKGSQRTTLDVRTYKWKGLDVTDVPGINAFNGKEDEDRAFHAARKADLIVFMINDGEPSLDEARWLVRLKTECDKPLLCLINCKSELWDDFSVDDFIESSSEYVMNPQRLDTIRQQFDEFIQKLMPGRTVPFVAVQLLAEQLSRKPEFRSVSSRLHKASCFERFERFLTGEIAAKGVLYKCRSYLSIVDSTVFQEYHQLLNQSESSYNSLKTLNEKIASYQKWQKQFMTDRLHQIHDTVDNAVNRMVAKMPAFVDDRIESSRFSDEWKAFVEGFKIDETIKDELSRVGLDMESKLTNLFRELKFEFKQNIDLELSGKELHGANVTNYKRIWGWVGNGVGALGVALGLLGVVSGPVGWAIAGLGFLTGLFSWFSDSREKKLNREKARMKRRLTDEMEKIRRRAHGAVTKGWHESIVPMENDGYKKLMAIRTLLISLANVERSLGFDYNEAHSAICKRMLNEAFAYKGKMVTLDDHYLVARIPEESWAVLAGKPLKYVDMEDALHCLGMRETFRTINQNKLQPELKRQVAAMFHIFNIQKRFSVESIDGYDETIIYIDKKSLTDEESKGVELVGQLLNAHFLQTLY